jgi:uncharacterized protein (DUF433 family)
MTVKLNFTDGVPLHFFDGSVRVIGSRITLDTIVGCYQMGDTPEDILDSFPSLTLEQINAIIGWYLNNRAEVDEYIREGEIEAEKVMREIESWPQNIAFREKMRKLKEQLIKN